MWTEGAGKRSVRLTAQPMPHPLFFPSSLADEPMPHPLSRTKINSAFTGMISTADDDNEDMIMVPDPDPCQNCQSCHQGTPENQHIQHDKHDML